MLLCSNLFVVSMFDTVNIKCVFDFGLDNAIFLLSSLLDIHVMYSL